MRDQSWAPKNRAVSLPMWAIEMTAVSRAGGTLVEYHRSELAIALDRSNAARAMPPIVPARHKRILDVGCGMGQTLIASQLPSDTEAYGVDCDSEAIEAGRLLAPANVKLLCARGEELPFETAYFDLVFSRVALPYMDINKALREICRVLKAGGDFWLTLHRASTLFSRAKRSVWAGDVKSTAGSAYVLLNGVLFNYLGVQLSFLGRKETFQTVGGILRATKRAGLICPGVCRDTHFIVQGQKPSHQQEMP
jgi:SAM-dependent methyltransferase